MSETSAKLVFRVPCPEKKWTYKQHYNKIKKINDRELKCLEEDKFYLISLQFQFNNPKLQSTFIFSKIFSKVHIFWEGHKILRNLHLTFVYSTYRQK